MPSTLLVKTVVVVDCCMFACIANDLQLLTKAVGLIYAFHCALLYFVVLVRRRRLSVHVESLEVDFFGLPIGHFGLAVRRSTSVGWKCIS